MPMSKERLTYLGGFAAGMAGTVKPRTIDEARYIGELMLELVHEVERLQDAAISENRDSEAVQP
jgi:hypothetical protein